MVCGITASLAALMLAGGVVAAPNPFGLWEFENGLSRSMGSGTMTSAGSLTNVGGSGGTYDGAAIQIPAGASAYLSSTHGMPVNGGSASYVRQYTLMWDVKYPTASTWKCLLQTNGANSNDGDLFIQNSSGKIGGAGQLGGYSGSATAQNTWYRIVMTCNTTLSSGDVKVYVNGTLWYTSTKTTITDDGTYALDPTFLISQDNDGEDDTLILGNFACWNSTLSATDVANLGSVGANIVYPVIAEGASMLKETPQSTPIGFSVSATDPNGDTLTWSVASGPAHGAVTGISGTGASKSGSYTPAGNFVGSDSFVVRVTDATGLTDVITINVNVGAVNDMPSFTMDDEIILRANAGARSIANWATNICDGEQRPCWTRFCSHPLELSERTIPALAQLPFCRRHGFPHECD